MTPWELYQWHKRTYVERRFLVKSHPLASICAMLLGAAWALLVLYIILRFGGGGV